MIVQNILVSIDLTPVSSVLTRQEQALQDKNRKIVKQGLWGLSNLAAMARPIIDYLRTHEDGRSENDVFFLDGTLDQVLRVMHTALKFSYLEIFREGAFFLAILSTEVTDEQMLQYLLNRDIV